MASKDSRSIIATEKVKNALRFIILAPATITGLTAISTLISACKEGEMEIKQFLIILALTIAGMAVNIIVYWIHEYKNGKS